LISGRFEKIDSFRLSLSFNRFTINLRKKEQRKGKMEEREKRRERERKVNKKGKRT
jgi:hypothetical protein